MDKIAPYWKAVVAFVVTLAGNLVFAVQDGSAGGSAITKEEWIAAALITVAATGGVWGTPNKDPNATHQAESVQPPYQGMHEG